MKKKHIIIAIAVFAVCIACAANISRVLQFIPTDFSKTEMIYDSDGVTRYYYHTLSENGKLAYTLILNSIREHPEEIEIPQLNDTDFHAMFCALSYDNPELLCMKKESQIAVRGAKAYFIPQYMHETELCESNRRALENAVENILNGVTEDMDAYDKELYFHDAICEKAVYTPSDDDTEGYSAYDALVQGRAVCEGYSRSIQLLLNHVGIPNYLVTGVSAESDGTSEGHMWNLVTIQGNNYYLDVTWDDMDEDEISRCNHTYFNVTSADIAKNHMDIHPENNNCTATEANYFVRQNLLISKYNAAAKELLVQEISRANENGTHALEVRFSDSQAYDKAVADIVDGDGISYLVYRAERNGKIDYQRALYVRDEDLLTLQIAFS